MTEEEADTLLVTHLSRNPERRGSVTPLAVNTQPGTGEKQREDLRVTVLSRQEERRGPVLWNVFLSR